MLESIEVVHSLVAAEIGLDHLLRRSATRAAGDGRWGIWVGELGRALQGLGRPPQPTTLQPAGIMGVRQALNST